MPSALRFLLASLLLAVLTLNPILVPIVWAAEEQGEGEDDDAAEAEAKADAEAAAAAAEAEAQAQAAAAAAAKGDVAGAQAAAAAASAAAGRAGDAASRGTEAAGLSASAAQAAASFAGAMAEAAAAVADANAKGVAINVDATLGYYGTNTGGVFGTNPDAVAGTVTGARSGVSGPVDTVAEAESVHAGRQAAIANVFATRFDPIQTTVPGRTLSQALGQVATNVVENTATVAKGLFGVTPAVASPVGLSITVGSRPHTTTDVVAFNNYANAVAPAIAARDAAGKAVNDAFDRNDQAAIDAALAQEAAANKQIDALQASYFGTPEAHNNTGGQTVAGIALAGTGGSSGTGTGTGGSSSAAGSTGGGSTPGLSGGGNGAQTGSGSGSGTGGTGVGAGNGGAGSGVGTGVGAGAAGTGGTGGSGRGSTGSGSGTGTGGTGTTGAPTGGSTYSYDSRSGSFSPSSGEGNGDAAAATFSGIAAQVAAAAGQQSVITVDTSKGVVAALDINSGKVSNYDTDGQPTTGSVSLSAAGVVPTSGTFTRTDLGTYKTTTAVQTTPSTDLATGKTGVGTTPAKLQTTALAHGYTITKPSEVLALGYVYEIDARTRANIVAAYQKNPDFSTLSDESVKEVSGILNAIAGEAARTNRTVAQQIAVPNYLTSVTVNEEAFDALANQNTRTALSALAQKLTDGTLSSARGLSVTAPVAEANHFYAAYINPYWADAIANPTEIGQYTKTVVGYIPSEINPAGAGAKAAVMRSPMLLSSDAIAGSVQGLAVTAKAPSGGFLAQSLAEALADDNASATGSAGDTGDATAAPVPGTVIDRNSSAADVQSFWSERNDKGARLYSSNGTALVNPNLLQSVAAGIQKFETLNPGYKVSIQGPASGLRTSGSTGNHGRQSDGFGGALDIVIEEVDTGNRLTNHPSSRYLGEVSLAAALPVYQKLYNEVVIAAWNLDPNLARSLRNGGYFGGGKNAADAMHIDVLGHKGTAGGSTLGGFTKAQMEKYGIQENHPLQSWENVGKLAEQRYGNGAGTGTYTEPATTAAEPGTTEDPEEAGVTDDGGTEPQTSTGKLDDAATTIAKETAKILENAGLPIEEKTIEELAPTIARAIVRAALPLPVTLLLQIIQRGSIVDWLPTGGTPVDPSDLRGESDCQNAPDTDTTCGAQPPVPSTVPVTITVDQYTGEIELSRDDLNEDIVENYEPLSSEEANGLVQLYSETPILFGDDGEILYSNGLYSPAAENGFITDDTTRYVYLIKYRDENGEEIPAETDDSAVPDSTFSRIINLLFTRDSSFTLEEVTRVTYRFVDPDPNVPGDEYYDYAIYLKNGDQRAVTMAQYSSISFMRERFGSIGYTGDVIGLISQATERLSPPQSPLQSLVEWFQDKIGFISPTNDSVTPDSVHTVLPDVSDSAANISAVFIYPRADVACPLVAGYEQGYAYTALINKGTDQVTVITDGRCGSGSAEDIIMDAAEQLQTVYGIKGATYENIADKTAFRFESIIYTPGVFTTYLSENSQNVGPEEASETPSASSSSPLLPNLTNTITFEVKAVGADGQVLSDWSQAADITISSGVQLYFRWDGSDYQQCLPFLNDNGNYSLTVKNRAMTNGNTETEGYNINERSGTYRIECGGQRNNEFGVDAREVGVRVE